MAELESFKYHLARKGIRSLTIKKHVRAITYLFSCCPSRTAHELEQFLFALLEQGKSPGYLNVLVQALRAYGKFIDESSYIEIKYFKVFETTKGILSDKEITDILDINAEEYERWLRQDLKRGGGHIDVYIWNIHTLFFRILSLTGLRPNELATMRSRQCDLGSKVFRLDATTKTSKPRTVSINDNLIPYLEEHLKRLEGDLLFSEINRDRWRYQFNMRIKYLGIKRDKISTYSLRHSWVTRLLDEGANPHVMAEMAGHSLEQQSHYYKLTSKSKRIAIQKDPLGRNQLTLRERMIQGRKALEDLGFLVVLSKELTQGFIFEVQENIEKL